MVLLDVLSKCEIDFDVLHVNYHLRGEDSDLDQQLVESICREKNIPIHLHTVEMGKMLEKEKGNLQAMAREIRYEFFNAFIQKSPSTKVILAHHQDDQIETFFLNLLRGGGVMALASMQQKSGDKLRPLLNVKKSEIEAYARIENVVFREDVSNYKNSYRRNRFRNEYLPFVRKSLPSIDESVILLVDVFQQNQLLLEQKLVPLVRRVEMEKRLSDQAYDALSSVECAELLRQLDLSPARVGELENLRKSEKGKFLMLDEIRIMRESDGFSFKKNDEVVSEKTLEIVAVNELPKVFTKNEIYLDPKKISGELTLRKWQIGDRIKLVGMKGSKLISDVLTDAKVSSSERADKLVLTDDKNIHWCVGHAIGRIALADPYSDKWRIRVVEKETN